MKFLRDLQDRQAKLFEKGGRLEMFYPLYEANDTFLFTPPDVTRGPSHVRDGLDLKRMMITVVVALLGCMFMACYNTGYQAFIAIANGAAPLDNWQTALYEFTGLSYRPGNFVGAFIYGALYYVPMYIVTVAVGGAIEAIFAIVRKHEINEGFLVTSALFPLTLAPLTPLWQVALGIAFGVFIGKEIFGGVGMNFLNPALVGRAFLFFAYPGQLSGDQVWIAAETSPDTYSGATLLAQAYYGSPDASGSLSGLKALQESGFSWWDAFYGLIPGSIGETSALFCLIGGIIIIYTGVGSWRVIAGCLLGSFAMVGVFNIVGSDTNPFFDVPFYWHWVLGSFAFAVVYMATDPVSASFTLLGKWVYGFFIGVLGILIRVINP
ncbi:MAG: NADH:ubiquinone reductase (Na(+)-transporting) subunit B, partial [Candidatus Hydrogenedentales bacterium]